MRHLYSIIDTVDIMCQWQEKKGGVKARELLMKKCAGFCVSFSSCPLIFHTIPPSIRKVRASDSNTTPECSIQFFVLYQLIV